MSGQTNVNPLRVVYAAGPGDVIGTYRQWRQGVEDPHEVARTYSGQFYEVCEEVNAIGHIISTHPERERLHEGRFTLEHRPLRFKNAGGAAFHLGQITYGLGLIATALRVKADVVVVSMGTHWFVLRALRLLGIRVVPTLHCVLWPKHGAATKLQRIMLKLGAKLFSKSAECVLSLSNDITRQVDTLTGGNTRPVIPFRPTYIPKTFASLAPPPERGEREPMRVLYAGRIERNKGVFDLLESARRLKETEPGLVKFDICGDGSMTGELQKEAERLSLTDCFNLHGHCNRDQMMKLFSSSHLVVVPTTSDFVEGFNKVVCESILAGRPCVTSSVCPALEYVTDAVLEVPADDVDAYTEAIRRLATDHALYERLREATAKYQPQFYSYESSWGSALKQALTRVAEPRGVQVVGTAP